MDEGYLASLFVNTGNFSKNIQTNKKKLFFFFKKKILNIFSKLT